MTFHELKCWPEPFAAVERGEKCHEVRKADRDFQAGDVLTLREWVPGMTFHSSLTGQTTDGWYTGRVTHRRVTYVTPPGAFGLPNDLCVMSIVPYSGPLQ